MEDLSQVQTLGVLPGNGVGPQLMEETLKLLEAADSNLPVREIPDPAVDPDGALTAIKATGTVLKGPLSDGLPKDWTASLGLFATVRKTPHLTLVREAASGLFAGTSTRDERGVTHSFSVTEEQIGKYVGLAFRWAERHGHQRVTCVTKENALPGVDGIVHRVFKTHAAEHTSLKADHCLIDTAVVALTKAADRFDLIVAPDLYGDIIGDVSASLAGPISLVAAARIGDAAALFEPIHGTAPGLVRGNRANPTGLILSAAMLLRHIGRAGPAHLIEAALAKAIADGIHTEDMAGPETTRRVATRVFTQAVISRLGETSEAAPTHKGVAA